jgi:hypothetical protein
MRQGLLVLVTEEQGCSRRRAWCRPKEQGQRRSRGRRPVVRSQGGPVW